MEFTKILILECLEFKKKKKKYGYFENFDRI
jgi:hypothetical protein